MIELLILFLVVIIIILCTISVTYKCTKRSMKLSDFSFDNCVYTENKTVATSENKVDIPDTPLMSEAVFETITGDEEQDYSNVIDYFELSRTAVRVDDENDYKDVYAATPGECAKICYEKEEDIGDLDYECNAFQTDGRRKCRIFWSVSAFEDKRTTDDQLAFRIKTPRDKESHEKRKEKEKGLTGQVYIYTGDNYHGIEEALPFQNYTSCHIGGTRIKSIIVPIGYAVELFTSKDYSGTSMVFYESQRKLPSPYYENVKSIKIAQISNENLKFYEDVYSQEGEEIRMSDSCDNTSGNDASGNDASNTDYGSYGGYDSYASGGY